MNKKFALIGAAGYIAPRHMSAIQNTRNNLVAAHDINDSVGIIDSYFPDAKFFTEFERFDRYLDKKRRSGDPIDYISICSPNYLHDSQIRFTIKSGADAICEKPLVLNPWNLDGLIELEKQFGNRVYTILQLRLHPAILELKSKVQESSSESKMDVELSYITSRGNWYLQSWKGDEKKSGGIATNIGIHFFDMLHFIFGELQTNIVSLREERRACGFLEYKHARVRWFLSIDINDVPQTVRESGQKTFRSINVSGQELEFSGGFTDLHTKSYQEILNGHGFGLEENRSAIEAVSDIRTSSLRPNFEIHPFAARKKI